MLKNIIANIVGRSWGILSNFLFIPLYIHILGFESYSVISFTLVITGLMAVIDVGLTATLSREFARKDNPREEKIRIFRTLETLYYGIITFVIVMIIALSDAIASKWLNLGTIPSENISLCLKIISIDVGFQLLFRFYMGGLLGLEKQLKANAFLIGWGILRNGIVVIAILFKPSLELFFTWQASSTLVCAAFVGMMLKRELMGNIRFNYRPRIEKTVFKKIRRFAGGMFLISLVAGLNTQMDKLAISRLLPVESLGYYTLAVSLSLGIMVLVNPVSIALLPRFTALYSEGKTDEASKLFSRINFIVSILAFSVMANMSFYARELIWIWTGKTEFSANASPFVPIMALSAAMLAIATIPYNIAIANGYTKINNLLGIVSLFITLPGYWMATRKFGPIGAAVINCLVQFLITVMYLYFINNKFLKTGKTRKLYVNHMLLPFTMAVMTAYFFSIFARQFMNQNRLLLFIWIAFGTALTVFATLLGLVRRSELKSMLGYLSKYRLQATKI